MVSAEEEAGRSEWARSWGVAEVNQVDQLGNWTGLSVIAKTHHKQSAISHSLTYAINYSRFMRDSTINYTE